MTETLPRTEIHLVRTALSGPRQDLITGAFAFRPLPRLGRAHPLVRRAGAAGPHPGGHKARPVAPGG
ncbi:hypothetical protein [Streptomyces sp. NPDC048636]|uniref:hypothetical protein n=1 Tax=Streptomyces sp. NPDC048636 TaxID=3155762 RepID=UPI00342059F3